ncbi:MAG: hypothetical protein R2867_40675 [Caldilineaceae bacterium]
MSHTQLQPTTERYSPMSNRPNILMLVNDHQVHYRHGWDGGVRPLRPNFDRGPLRACALIGPIVPSRSVARPGAPC